MFQIFGPDMQNRSFKETDEVIARANDTEYGLAAAVFSNDVNKIYKVSSALKAGTVWANTYNVLVTQVRYCILYSIKCNTAIAYICKCNYNLNVQYARCT